MLEVSIIVCCWNHLEDVTKPFLDEIFKTRDIHYELIFIDNGSHDGTFEYLTRFLEDNKFRYFYPGNIFPKIKIHRLDKNQGFSGGNNVGFTLAEAPYICALNNDVLIDDPMWLRRLIDFAKENPKTAVGPRLVSGQPSSIYKGQLVPYLEGWCLVIDRSFMEKWGFFHPDFSMAYGDDIEFSARLKHYGWDFKELCVGIRHIGQRTSFDQWDQMGGIDKGIAIYLRLMEEIEADVPPGKYLAK